MGSPRVVVVRPTHGDGSVVSSVSSVSSGQIIITHQPCLMLSDDVRWIFRWKNRSLRVPFIWDDGFFFPHIMWPLMIFHQNHSPQGPSGLMNWCFGYESDPRIRKGVLLRGGIPRLPNHPGPNLPLLEKSIQFSDTSSQWLPKITPKSHLVLVLLVTVLCFPFFFEWWLWSRHEKHLGKNDS